MKFLYSLTGANHPVIKEFDITNNSRIYKGELLVRGNNGQFGPYNTGTVVGVAQETHTAEKDALNPRNKSNKVRVDITRGGVYEIDAFTIKSDELAAENTLVCNWTGDAPSFVGCKVVLMKKGSSSTNTDEVGAIRTISAESISGGKCTFTFSEGGRICYGDEYAVIPPLGYVGTIKNDRKSFVPNGPYSLEAKVVGSNTDTCKLEIILDGKMFD